MTTVVLTATKPVPYVPITHLFVESLKFVGRCDSCGFKKASKIHG